jgi:sugar (pentulose or hexulose) kinase
MIINPPLPLHYRQRAVRERGFVTEGFAIVVDVGKTLTKVTLWSRTGRLLDRRTRPNASITVHGIRRLDAEGIATFVEEAIACSAGHPVEFILPVAHGAALAALAQGKLAFPPLDYEQSLPESVLANYRSVRASFQETGSPALPAGLNAGAQLFWLDQLYPGEMPRTLLMPWPQYWAWFLSGTAVSEVSSLGCHTDLWAPSRGTYSSLARDMGWADRFAPLAKAGEVVGTLRPELAARTGLPPATKVLAGLHDSNAALLAARGYAEIADGEATVLSTGTWFVAMRLAGEALDLPDLPEARDCLVNVDVEGQPVPSARFMGGREIETLIEIDTRQVDIGPDQPKLLAAVQDIVRTGAMVVPTLSPGCGPFPEGAGGWVDRPVDWYARRACACLYAALVADSSLKLIGFKGRLLVEGRFAEAEVFVRALAALRPECEVYRASAHNDVGFGALRLIDPSLRPAGALRRIAPLDIELDAYRDAWRAASRGPA